MGLFSSFKKQPPDEIYREIALKIVSASLLYRTTLKEKNPVLTASAGAELAYLLLHLIDRAAFRVLGAERRNAFFDSISAMVIGDYSKAVLNDTAPTQVIRDLALRMFEEMNSRQGIYGACASFTGDPFPHSGTMVFALSYFIHSALEKTDRVDVADILVGRKKLTPADLDAFPEVDEIMLLAVWAGNAAAEINIKDYLKQLQ